MLHKVEIACMGKLLICGRGKNKGNRPGRQPRSNPCDVAPVVPAKMRVSLAASRPTGGICAIKIIQRQIAIDADEDHVASSVILPRATTIDAGCRVLQI